MTRLEKLLVAMKIQGKEEKYKYTQRGAQWMADILENKIISCRTIYTAVKRTAGFIEKAYDNPEYHLEFNAVNSEKFLRLLANLPHIKGKWANNNENIDPIHWHCWVAIHIYGLVKKGTNLRVTTQAMISVPRKNVKTTLGSPMLIYALALDGEQGAEVYCAATKREQAKIAYSTTLMMLRKAEKNNKLCSSLGIQISRGGAITCPRLNSAITVLSKSTEKIQTHDGLSPHFALADEVHAHPDSSQWNVLANGMGARDQPLLVGISTSGSNTDGIAYQLIKYGEQVNAELITDDSFFCAYSSLDDEKEAHDPDMWQKANISMGFSIDRTYLEQLYIKAKTESRQWIDFLIKNMNMWVASEDAWILPEYLYENMTELKWPENKDIMVQVDLSQVEDPTCVSCAWIDKINGQEKFCFKAIFFLPEEVLRNIEHPNFAIYREWQIQKHIISIEGSLIDKELVTEWIIQELKEKRKNRIKEIQMDPYYVKGMDHYFTKRAVPVVFVGQTVRNFSGPLKAASKLFEQKSMFAVDKNPVNAWMFSNVSIKEDLNENWFPKKASKYKKIDSAICWLMAYIRWSSVPSLLKSEIKQLVSRMAVTNPN